jgi:hypothetical protein
MLTTAARVLYLRLTAGSKEHTRVRVHEGRAAGLEDPAYRYKSGCGQPPRTRDGETEWTLLRAPSALKTASPR